MERFFKYQIIVTTLSLFLIVFLGYNIFAPSNLGSPVTFTINEGESLRSLTDRLEEKGVVKSSTFLRAFLSFNNKDRKVQLGEYEFFGEISLASLARQITEDGPKYPLLAVTVPEGSTSFEVFQIFAKALPSLNMEVFSTVVDERALQGKLFPSTYHLLPSYKEVPVIDLMSSVYSKKVTPLLRDVELPVPLKDEKDALVLASILEGEANSEKDMKIVAGILLERMRIGMALQVDAATSTYKTKGLPKEPINNPGLISIGAAISPVYTEYLYYITGKDGSMYYAKTFNDHKRNIQKYLR
jgi:UPF0755 protein